ncbi:MAG: NusG domain II-containing protein [Desulfobacterales bacterium]
MNAIGKRYACESTEVHASHETRMPDSFYAINGVDVILIVAVVCVFVGVFLYSETGFDSTALVGSQAKGAVFSDGVRTMQMDLHKNRTYDLADGRMRIETKDGRIHVVRSSCPNKICVNSGWIESPGQIIACVPNKIIIQVDTGRAPLLDAVVE